MKESTKILFIWPILFQEMIPFVVLVPILVFFFRYISESVVHNFMPVVIGASVAAILGLFLGCITKYYFVSPAIRILEKASCTPEEIQHAVHHAAYLPLAESIVVFLRFALFGNLIAATPLYLKGYIQYSEYLFALNSVTMIGMLAIPIFYLASENSLVHFFIKCNFKGIFDSEKGFFSINMSSKTLLTILLIAVPPIGLLTGLIYLSPATGLNPASLQMSFCTILVETILIAVICGFLLMKNFSLSVGRMSIMFRDMAKGQGDLTKRLHVTGLNEIGRLSFWFNEFMNDIEEIIGDVMEASFQLHQTIEDVSSGSQILSQATQEQASSIEGISASIEEMNTTVLHNGGLITEGQESSNAITKLIGQSKQLFSELMKAIESISMDSKKIWDIVSTVNEVAFHTNLLALNASVEAARAGEHGKGFAVVAGEVRSLAQRSAEAASEIKVLIESTVGRIKNGDEMMKKTSASLEELMSRMEFFFKLMDIISTSSTEQKQNISELNMAIGQIGGSTQHNAATVEELAGTLDNLRTAALLLAEDVQKFKTS